jgi:hypothetical protein
MIFTLEVLKAFEGDCLLLHWGDPANPRLAIIDGGPGRTYELHLRERLDEIVDNRGGGPIDVEFVMVSHVDNDHIVGIDKLFGDLRREVQDNQPRPLRVKRLWHNTFDDIVGNKLDAHYQAFTASFTASAEGTLPAGAEKPIADRLKAELGDEREAEHIAHDISMVLAGHKEGRNLRDKHKYLREQNAIGELNAPFSLAGRGTLITAQRTPEPIDLKGLKIQIVGPREQEIAALQAKFDEYLEEHGLATAEAMLAAYADKSVPNLSSIVCIASMEIGGKVRTMLLTGDARGDHMIECLRNAGFLDGSADEHLHVDLLKVPHHGSERNVEPRFFEQITADTYVLSANGKHGNPDRAAIEWIIDSRDKEDDYHIVLTYPVDALDSKRREIRGAKWDEQSESLAVLFEERKQQGYKFRVTTDAPMPLELGDEKIGF